MSDCRCANPAPPVAAPAYRAYMASDVHGDLVIDVAQPRADSDAARPERTLLLVCLLAASGLIHARAAIDHASHYWLFGLLFGVLAYAQVLWAFLVYRRPDDRRRLTPALVGSLAVVGVWLVSRTAGLPIGPWAGRPEPLAVTDVTATLTELILAALIAAMLWPGGRVAARMRWLDGANCLRVGSMLVALSLLAVLVGNHAHPGT